ncbi:AraC family transcriptional regulator [Clostridium tertium]|uniref:helix-turn-helix domain-containing protein n=1 Tax=Clostridium tertium TaxID=1559 RepID=UPI002330D90E|nr:AraC family transcriptional regulator [Clostridium tertium]MDB1931714.1 AraC family transcriptional regulator [Clostridium tertium]MDB1938240.1 AraC family transcriptional regulator [Clostridium tertium]
MRERIKKIIEHIERNYHEPLSEELIENITGSSAGYFRNEFSKNVGISLDKYRIRRSLTLIIKEIKENKAKIVNSNVLPWQNNKSFHEAFKKEFRITPREYLKGANINLQDKFNIDKLIEEDKLIKSLVRKCGTYEKALIYLLKLPVYRVRGLRYFYIEDEEQFYESLILNYCRNNMNDKDYDRDNIDKIYKVQKKNLQRYYNLDEVIEFRNDVHKIENEHIPGNPLSDFMKYSYFVVDRSLLSKLIKLINLEKLFELINFEDIKTIWHDEIILERGSTKEGIVMMPREFIEMMGTINWLEWEIVHELIIMENGYHKYKNFEEFKKKIKYNYSKQIENENLCDSCKYKEIDNITGKCKFSEDDSCEGYENLTEEEEERFFKEEYEILTMEDLLNSILYLFNIGMLFL